MDHFYLDIDRLEQDDDTDVPHYQLDIVINGRRFIDMVREVEQPFAEAEGKPDWAGQYQHLPPWVVLLPSRYLLPDEERYLRLLICEFCGVWGCWPLEARVLVENDQVIWRDFCQPHRSEQKPPLWQYEGLGPFTFERQQYEAELGKLLGDETYQETLWYWADWLQGDWVQDIQQKVVSWAKQQSNIRAAALVGSRARNQATLQSDIDLLLLTSDPSNYRFNSVWPAELGVEVEKLWHDLDYGVAWSRNLTVFGGLKLEMIFEPLSWASTAPLDARTAQVVNDGCQILFDPDGLLSNLIAYVDQAA